MVTRVAYIRAAAWWLSVPFRYAILIAIPPRHRYGPGRLAKVHEFLAIK